MSYIKTLWQNDITKLNADNLNHLENGIYDVSVLVDNIINGLTTVAKATADADGNVFSSTYAKFSDLSNVATSGSYNDLIDKPVIDDAISSTSTNAVQNAVIYSALATKQNNLIAGTNITIQNNVISATVLNEYSNVQNSAYSANYANKNFAPISYVSNLYAHKTSTSGLFNLTNETPALSSGNTYIVNSTNVDFNDYSTPELILQRTLSTQTTIGLNNSFEIDIKFTIDRDETLSFGGRIEVSTDNGTTWNAISSNQATSSDNWLGSTGGTINGNTIRFSIQTDLVTEEITYPRGTLFRILIFKKQDNASTLATTYYFGVEVDSTPIYTFAKFNFTNVYISSNQIANGSITYQKLSPDLKQKIDDAGSMDYEIHTISEWYDNSGGSDTFIYSNSFNLIDMPESDTVVELVNDDAEKFAEYGFSLLRIVNKNVLIGATKEPLYPVSFKILTYKANQKAEPLPDEPEIDITNNTLTITNASSYPQGTSFDIYIQKQGMLEPIPVWTMYDATQNLYEVIAYAGLYQIVVKANVSGQYSAFSETKNYTMQPGLYVFTYNQDTWELEVTLEKSWSDMITDEELDVSNHTLNGTSFSGYAANRLVISNDIYAISDGVADVDTIMIPAETTTIGNEAFAGSNSSRIYFEDVGQVISLGTGIFKGSGVSDSVQFPESINTIPDETFKNCQQLFGIALADVIKYIGLEAFANVVLSETSVWLQEVQEIMANCFENCNLTDIYLSSITDIGSDTFSGCTLTIHYAGTQAEWNNVNKDANWDRGATITMSYEDDGQGGN